MILHSSETNAPWFEHDQCTVSINVLMNCTHLDSRGKSRSTKE
ncbi:putative zinc ribbon protein [Klebsiella michiganensis]